jgi:HEAT repeat protein
MSKTLRCTRVGGRGALPAFVLALAAIGGASPLAQDGPAARAKAVELSRTWAAIGEGDYARAQRTAGELRRRYPSDHAAIAVSVAAIAGAGQPTAALDAYEQWLQRTRHEDVFLLQPIAAGTLAAIAASPDAGLAAEALSRLAASDRDAAQGALARRTDAGPEFDGVRAALGDKPALQRLVANFSAPTSREKLLALHAAAGVSDLPPAAITPMLADPAPPVRVAAIETLARVQGPAATDALRPLLDDEDAFVKGSAAVALGRLGDPSALAILTQMLQSDAGDTIAMAAIVLKERGLDVSGAADRILADPNPLSQLAAIPLLPDASRAQALINEAASDPNPVVRGRAARFMSAAANDLPAIRRLLRDPGPEVRLNAAEALLRLAGSGR